MTFEAVFLRAAQADLDAILEFLGKHSPAGAAAWLEALELAIDALEEHPHRYAKAPENELVTKPIQNISFKTRKGRPYRLVFTVVESEVRVLRILGPGHNLLGADELK